MERTMERMLKVARVVPSADDDEQHRERAELAAILVQRAVRRQFFLHRDAGPMLLCMRGGTPANWGKLNFARGRVANFLSFSDTTSEALLANIFQRHWRIPSPDAIISITGGAQDFVLTPQLHSVFKKGLVDAVSCANVWMVTGGTDSGVMKLVGNTMASVGHKRPLIGVAAWGVVNGREKLVGCHGGAVRYAGVEAASRGGAPLNPHHTHFLLVRRRSHTTAEAASTHPRPP